MRSRPRLGSIRLVGQPLLRTQTDERLVNLAQSGYEPAFEAIVARYRRPLQVHCAALLGEEDAEDAVQESFMKAHGAMRRGEVVERLRPWLYRIAHNTALNVLRDRVRRPEPLDDVVDPTDQPDQVAEGRQDIRDVLAAVQALPPRQRDAVLLRELEGRSYAEIAEQLGASGGAVRQLLNRARTSIRAGLTAVTPIGVQLCRAEVPSAVTAKLCASVLAAGAIAGPVSPIAARHHEARAVAPATTSPEASPAMVRSVRAQPSVSRVVRTPARAYRRVAALQRGRARASGRPGPGRHRQPEERREDDRSGPSVGSHRELSRRAGSLEDFATTRTGTARGAP